MFQNSWTKYISFYIWHTSRYKNWWSKPPVPGRWTRKTLGRSWKVGFLCTCCICWSMCTKISWRKYFLKIFLKEIFSFLLSRKLALLTKNLHATLVKPTLNSRMEIVWQQSFDLFLCNTNNFIFRKFIHWIYFDISRNLHSFVIVSSLLCVVLSEVILQKLYINISTLQWWFQDKIKFILRYLPIEKKFTRQYQNANKKKCDANWKTTRLGRAGRP